MTTSSFGINVVSRSHVVVCRACGAGARRVGATCDSCGASLAGSGFAIMAAEAVATGQLRRRLHLRRATAA